MTVEKLIEELSRMPKKADVGIIYDGFLGDEISDVWLARNGTVAISDGSNAVYRTAHRPEDAPTADEEPYWSAPL